MSDSIFFEKTSNEFNEKTLKSIKERIGRVSNKLLKAPIVMENSLVRFQIKFEIFEEIYELDEIDKARELFENFSFWTMEKLKRKNIVFIFNEIDGNREIFDGWPGMTMPNRETWKKIFSILNEEIGENETKLIKYYISFSDLYYKIPFSLLFNVFFLNGVNNNYCYSFAEKCDKVYDFTK